MHLTAVIAAVVCLLLITYEDFTSRSVRWVYFPLLAVSGVLAALAEPGAGGMGSGARQPLGLLLVFAGWNIGFLALQFVLLVVYFRVRGGSPIRRGAGLGAIMDNKIGWGDVFFLFAACFFFSPVNFIAYYIISLVISLGIAGVRIAQNGSVNWPVPLAGLQAIFLLLILLAGAAWHRSPLNDDWLMTKIIPS